VLLLAINSKFGHISRCLATIHLWRTDRRQRDDNCAIEAYSIDVARQIESKICQKSFAVLQELDLHPAALFNCLLS